MENLWSRWKAMENIWITDGTPTEADRKHIELQWKTDGWNPDRKPMENIWNTDEKQMEHRWKTDGKPIEHTWMENILNTDGTPTEN